MKNLKFIFIFIIFILPMVNGISLYNAQDVAKEYMQSNEFIDSSFYYVKCDSNEYYMIGIVDGKGALNFFIPVESNNGNVLYQTNENTKNVLRTAQLYRQINTKSGNNYLSQQLLDRIDNLNTILKSKSAKYDGIIKSNYSTTINQRTTETKSKVDSLISQLDVLYKNLVKLQKEQTVFLDTADCKKVDSILQLYKTSFSGYNKLISESVNYKDSINNIIEVVVADKTLDETTKRLILSYIEAPSNLSSEISTISEYLSSTSQFYQEIVSEFERTGPNSTIDQFASKIKARQDFYLAKTALYSYDSELKDNLNNAINTMLSENNINYWKDKKTITELSQNYNQILELYNKGKYTEALPKITLAKSQVKKISKAGVIEIEQAADYTYLIFVVVGLFLLIAIIFLFKKLSSPKKKNKKSKEDSTDPEYLLNKRDPFR
jgi:hypothetical protein